MFNFQPCYLLREFAWQETSLNFSFLIYKVGIMVSCTPRVAIVVK